MEAQVRNGGIVNGKVAELFVKIGIAKPEGESWPVAKKKPVKVVKPKPVQKPKTKVKK